MELDLKRPLVFFDLEATGIDIIHDRIVELAFIKVFPDGKQNIFHKKINPTISIPEQVSKIHGIYDKDVKEAPTFKIIAKDVLKFLAGVDIAGFNIVRFDIPLLMEEFLRVDMAFDIDKRKIIDVQQIFHLMEKRTLSAAYTFYCKKKLDNAHSALADTAATVDIFKHQVERYKGKKVFDTQLKCLGTIENNINTLHDVFNATRVDLANRLTYDENRQIIFNFGQHKGKKVTDILKNYPKYYDWIMKSNFPADTKRRITQIRLQMKLQI